MNFNANTPKNQRPPLRGDLEIKYARSRANLLLVFIASLVNLFTLALNGSYFLFSASIPSFLIDLIRQENPEVPFADLIVPIAIGILLTLPYLLCWIFSKKRPGWMVAALVLFTLDFLLLISLYTLTSVIVDILFHVFVMFYLVTGVINGFKLKNMPEDEPLPAFGAEAPAEAPAEDSFNTFNEADFAYTAEATEDNNASTEE